MKVLENISLKPYNTFGIDVLARYFSSFSDLDQLTMCVTDYARIKKVILGMGSNILFTGDVDGMILKNEIMGIEKIREDDEFVYLRAGAGENWHQFVLYCVERDLAGVENLSLIPGTVGAAPMQNIGAYGVELEEVFHSLDAFHIQERTIKTFEKNECAFGYRKSVFKNRFKDRFVILTVTFRLRKKPVFNVAYGAIRQELEKMKVKELSIRAVSQAVIRIRSSKLPDPAVIGNAGSFFKNPEITREQFEELRVHYPEIPHYPVKQYDDDEDTKDKVKLAAGWLIEQCGWKGFRRGDAGVHDKQSLVLVNYGHASGNEIYHLSEEILESVYQKFNIMLEREVNVI